MADKVIDFQHIDDVVLALMYLTLHDQRDGVARVWKGFDWDCLDRLRSAGLIADPVGKARSVMLTPEGLSRSKHLFDAMFVINPDRGPAEYQHSARSDQVHTPIDGRLARQTDPLIVDIFNIGWLSARTYQCLLRIPAQFPALGIAPDEAASSLRISHIAPLPCNELLTMRNVSRDTCREIAVVIDRLGWRDHTHAVHPLRADAVGVTSAWIKRFDQGIEQRHCADKRTLTMLALKAEGLTNAEIGEKEGISSARVSQLLKRARSV